MKTVTFIKDHPVGIKEGRTVNASDHDAARWQKDGYVTVDGDAGDDEPEFIDHKVTKADTKNKPGWFDEDVHVVGGIVKIPNPKFV